MLYLICNWFILRKDRNTMKIEMGESLLYSWLRHVKECQIVQTNWKVSPKWEFKNEKEIRSIMEQTGNYFQEKYGYSIYKNNSLEQLLMQAEVDVLGISMGNPENKIYAIDVAFHEAGLNYGSREETVTRVIKKCIRTAMCIYGYMNICEAEIIFASPKINPAVVKELEPRIEEINVLFQKLGLSFHNRLIANEEFNGKVLKPILLASDGISDTSELFLRSFQMYNMFSNEDESRTKIRNAADHVESNLSDETLKELKIGRLVQTTMKQLFDKQKISQEEIGKMLSKEYSKKTFNANLPVLIEVLDGREVNELRMDINGYPRYYADTLSIYGKRYLLSSQWTESLHRSYYEKWLAEKI